MQERVPMAPQFQDYESDASGTEDVEISPTAAYIEKAAVHVADYLRGRADRRRARAEERVAYDSYAENIVAGDHASKNPNARTAGYDTTSDNAEEFFASFRADRAKKDERWMNGKPAEPNSTEGRRYDREAALEARTTQDEAYDSYAENIVAGDHASKNPNARTAGYDTTSDNAEEFFASFRADRAKKDERWMNGKPAEPNSTEGRRYDRKEARNRRQKQRSLGVMAVFSAVLAGAAEYTRTRAALSEEAQTY